MKINQLSVLELEKFFLKIYENACELIEEAEILHSHQKYARSYFCAHTALEEFAKLPILTTTAIKVYNKQKVDWNTVNKRINKHDIKISMGYSTIRDFFQQLKDQDEFKSKSTSIAQEMPYIEAAKKLINEFEFNHSIEYFKLNVEEGKLIEKAKESYSMTKLLKEYREGSMYTDYDGKNYIKPSDKIDKEICEYGLINAYIQKKYIEGPNIHNDGFTLYKYEDTRGDFLETLTSLTKLKEETKQNKK